MRNEYFGKVEPRLKEIKKWIAEGTSEKQIAEKLGVSYKAVMNYRSKYPEFAKVLDERNRGHRNLEGQRFGQLVVVEYVGENTHHNPMWLCKCDCGNTVLCSGPSLIRGHSRTCGCYKKEHPEVFNRTMHGKHDTRLYSIWTMMKNRCADKSVKNYGGRGISVCEEWKRDFMAFYEWAINNGYSAELTIDRIDNNGNYSPDNCRWATVKEQARNRRTNHHVQYKGKDYILTDLATELNVSRETALRRAIEWQQEEEKASMRHTSSRG